MAGRPKGSQNKDKPFRDALRLELAEAENDPKSLRAIARNLIKIAGGDKDAMPAIREIADRLDGKPAQAIIGGDEDDPAIRTITQIELIGVRPATEDT